MVIITRHCRIQHQKILDGGSVVYRREGTLDQFMEGAWRSMAVSYPKFYKMDRLSKLGLIGVEVLLKDVNLLQSYSPESIALVLSNAYASLDTDMRYFETTRTIASPALFVYTLSNIVSGEICIRHGFKGENVFFIMPKFDPDTLVAYVESVIVKNRAKACIAGWVDLMADQHDVLLYLAEISTNDKGAMPHTSEQLQKLYQGDYGTVDGTP